VPDSHNPEKRRSRTRPPAAPFVVWVDRDGCLRYADADTCHSLGYSPRELSSRRVWDIFPMTEESWPHRWASLKQRLQRSLLSELRTRTGGILPVRLHLKYATVDGKEYAICTGLSNGPAAVPVEFTGDAIFVLHNGRVVDSNRNGPELFGTSREQIIAELENSLPSEDVSFHWHSFRPDGSRFLVECTLFRIEVEGHVRLLAVAVDVTARQKSEHTLAQLSGRLLQMQDEERRRIARELHDTTGQNLGALSINLSLIQSVAAGLDARTRETLAESLALVDSSLGEIRTMSYLLHPPLLDELGLVSALRAYSEGYAERTGIRVDVEFPAKMSRLPQAIEIALFRIVQEGLTNIHRHSASRTATLRLKHLPDRVELEVADSGRGLPPGTLEWDIPSASRIGVGIAGMRERARQLSGRLTIASSETGTTLLVVLPLVPQS
jgi:signal transduction histidine kinase